MGYKEQQKESLEEEIEDARHQIRRCLWQAETAEKNYTNEYSDAHDAWLAKKRDLENASEELRGELQEDVDGLFEKMNKIEQDKRLSSEDCKLEYDKWCGILKQKEEELKELCWRD